MDADVDDERLRLIAAGYDRAAADYLALESESEWPRLRWVERVLDGLPPGSSVLDLGCGNGLPATKAAAAEHDVVGVDVSPKMVELARENVPGAAFHVGGAETVDLPSGHFDAVLALYLLDHVPREELPRVLARIRGWLKPGGVLLATFEIDDLPDTVSTWLGVPMFFSCYPPEKTTRIVEDSGFAVRAAEIETQVERTTEIPYLWVIAEARREA